MIALPPLSRRWTLALALVLPSLAPAQECTVGPEVLRSQLARKLPRGVSATPGRRKGRSFTQEVKLAGKVRVTLEVGGCERLAYSVGIRSEALTTRTPGAELVAVARRVLPQLPLDARSSVDGKLLLHAVEEAAINSLPAELPCGSATCVLSLVPDPQKPKGGSRGKPAPKKSAGPQEKPGADEAPVPAILRLSYEAGG